ncbi:MAG: anthranilate synthase component I [Thermincola sp.]|nr:anthranilate synthase component I [Thermincola sp.]MDT3703744.1 anthranilate synthase component I [Thermincola sp.]
MFHPSQEQYLQMARNNNLIPVYTELFVDMDTPISIFKKVCKGQYTYLLESVEGGENLARYSFIGLEPFVRYQCRNGHGIIEDSSGIKEVDGDPLSTLQGIMDNYQAPKIDGLPRFYGGAVGYFGYDLIKYVEEIPEAAADDLDLPDCHFILTRLVLIFDHVKHKVKIVVNTEPGGEPAKVYEDAMKRINAVKKLVQQSQTSVNTGGNAVVNTKFISNMTKEEFMAKVEKAKEYIRAGDIFQVVLSQRLTMPLNGDPFDIYRNLRTVNPAPYLYYLNFGGTVIIGSSPEMLIRVEDGMVQTCPIAGTRPRGQNKEEDRKLEKELLADEKETAEHLMLVDLGRNDVGRVSEFGSVEVKDFMQIERYSHVMHIVSNVFGRLKKSCTAYDALKACFPAGTVSGAPKVRAMEIIEELEPTRRGVYAGAIGYFGFTGNMDTCITIRTILVHNGKTYVQAGAGIVADSDPEKEYDETINKAKALLETLMLKEVG